MEEHTNDMSQIRAEAREWLVYLNSDEVTAEGQVRFETWLNTSPQNLQAYRRAESLWRDIAQLHDLADLEAPDRPGLSAFFYAFTRRTRQIVAQVFGRPLVPITAGAVVLFLILAINDFPIQLRVPAPVQYATRVAEVRDVQLPDGSMVTLGARSNMEVSFSRRERQVVLTEGEAFFSVEKAPSRPFYVAAGHMLVRVTGTKFDVRHDPRVVRTAVLEGTVEVMRATAGGLSESHTVDAMYVITAGQQVVFGPSGMHQAKAEEPGAWRNGRLAYVDASLDEVIADANRYSDTPISFAEKELTDLRVTAAYRTDQIDVMLESLAKTYPIDVERASDGRIILKSRRG